MEKQISTFKIEVPGKEPIYFETGWKAKQTNGSIWAKQGETVVLLTAVSGRKPESYVDFFPLTVNYIEKFYSVGKVPGGFFKRESRPSDRETLTSRLIDRPLRPMFEEGFRNETQVVATVVSYDGVHTPDILALNAASAALIISDIPFSTPVGSVRVGKKDGELFLNPSFGEFDELDINVIISGTSDAIVMVEGGMDFASEEDVLEVLEFGHDFIKTVIAVQDTMKQDIGKEKMSYDDFSIPEATLEQATSELEEKIVSALSKESKTEKYAELDSVKKDYLAAKLEEKKDDFVRNFELDVFKQVEKKVFRKQLLETKIRIDGRALTDVRPIDIEVGLLPRAHGSALFTRGETQALVSVTLGSSMDSQMSDEIIGNFNHSYYLHYNFPPYSVGEVGRIGAPGRREVGHSALAQRGLSYTLPSSEAFPYTIRVVSEILESNGSSSMATVCGGCLALMQAGVPVKESISGIAMGLVYEKGEYVVLTDILGLEDHLGDMDFKVTGSERGITALQMDIKIEGLSKEILQKALRQALDGRLHILGEMNKVMNKSNDSVSKYAPVNFNIQINPEKIGALIGPQGKIIKGIIERTGASIDIGDTGFVQVFAPTQEHLDNVKAEIDVIIAEVEEGVIYHATVKKLMNFGAFVELIPGTDALLHISQISHERVEKVEDVLKVGDKLDVKVIGKDRIGKWEISRKVLLSKDD